MVLIPYLVTNLYLTLKECRIMAFWAIFRGFGPLFYLLCGGLGSSNPSFAPKSTGFLILSSSAELQTYEIERAGFQTC